MKCKRVVSLFLTLIMVIGMFAIPVKADNDIKVLLDGQELNFDVPPQLINSRTMVPMRKIFEAMGATVDWNGNTQTVTAIKNDITVIMQIDNTVIKVNGENITLDVPPQLVDSRTLVPARAVAESLKAKVDWDGATSTVIISTYNSVNAYNYLKSWLLENGEANGSRIGVSTTFRELQIGDFDGYFDIKYEANSNSIYFSIWSQISETEARSALIVLKDEPNHKYTYVTNENTKAGEMTHKIGGTINAPYYMLKGPLAYEGYEGPKIHESEFAEISRAMIEIAVTCFGNFLILQVPELDISDFGFNCFE